jgi:hypothetical protein
MYGILIFIYGLSILYQHYYPILNVSFVFTNVNGVFMVFTNVSQLVLTTPFFLAPKNR